MENEYEGIMDFLSNLKCKFKVVEDKINPQIQKEYFEYSNSVARDELEASETQQLIDDLFSPDIPESIKKKNLVLLSHQGTVEVYRPIEKYHSNYQSEEMKQWSALAMNECAMFLESSLLDENISLVSSGLGGLKDKLRFYYLLLPLPDKLFTGTQQNIIKDELNYAAEEFNCNVETVDLSSECVAVTALIPMTVGIATFVNVAVEKSNELGRFVLEGYFATNQEIPDANKTKYIIEQIRGGEKLREDLFQS
jgi:hypothetical protein